MVDLRNLNSSSEPIMPIDETPLKDFDTPIWKVD